MLEAIGFRRAAPFTVNGKKAPILEMMMEKTKEIRDFFKLPQNALMWMKRTIDYYGLNQEDPFRQKVTQALTKCQAVSRKVLHTDYVENKVSDTPNQLHLTVGQMEEKIRNEGSSYTSLILNNVDDALIELVVATCTNLTELRIQMRSDRMMLRFSDKGISSLLGLKKLTKLELNCWGTPHLTPEGYTALLSDAGFQATLTELKIVSTALVPDLIPLFGKFKVLEKLCLQSCFLTSACLQTLSLPSTITELNLIQATSMSVSAFSDAVLARIAKLTSLRSLYIGGDNNVTDAGALALLKALPNLEQLTWNDFVVDEKFFNHLPATLKSLSLGNVTGLFYVNGIQNFLKKATLLTSLCLQNSGFGSDDIIPYLPSTLTHLYMDTTGLGTLKGLPRNLEYLCIQNSTQITPSQFAELNDIPLRTLRLLNCPTLNDEAFKSLAHGILKHTLQTFEIYNASISKESVRVITMLSRLTTLMIGQCYGLGLAGTELLLKSPVLMGRISRLYLDGPIIHLDMVDLLNDWEKLRDLFVGNMMEFPLSDEASNKFTKVKPIVESNGVVQVWYGEVEQSEFLHPLGGT